MVTSNLRFRTHQDPSRSATTSLVADAPYPSVVRICRRTFAARGAHRGGSISCLGAAVIRHSLHSLAIFQFSTQLSDLDVLARFCACVSHPSSLLVGRTL